MATVTLTPSACSSAAGWTVLYNYLTTNSSYYPRQLLFTYDNSSTLAGAEVNITKVTVHGYVRNSNSAVKRLRIGFRPSADSGVSDWAMLDNEAVLDQTFTAIDGYSGSGYAYAQIAREFAGNSLFARWIQQQFAAGEAVYLGVIQPDKSKSISVDTTLANWTIDVDYELLGNIPTTDKSTITLGSAITTTINRIIDGSTTTLAYKIGDKTLKTVELGTGTTDSYTVLASAGSNFPNDLTGTLTVEATTSKDGTTYGVITTSVTLTLPDDAAPNFGLPFDKRVWSSDIPASAQLAAYIQLKTGKQFGGYMQPKYGAQNAKLEITVEGTTYTQLSPPVQGYSDIIHPYFTTSGNVPFTAIATDTRGITSTYTGSVPVIAWSAPKIQAFSVSRANSDGSLAIDGTCAYVTLQASVSSLIVSNAEKNTLSFAVQYKKLGTTDDWTTCDTVTGSSVSGTFTGLLQKDSAIVDTFDDMSGYAFQAVVTDLYASSTAQDEMPTKEQFLDIDEATGKMGFGGDAPTASEAAAYRFYKFVDLSGGYKVYSTDETATGNTWIDGKPIYRACVKTTSSLVNAIGVVATLPSAVDTPISLSAFVKFPGDGGWRPVPTSYSGNLSWSVLVFVAGADVSMGFGASWTGNKDIIIIIEYTKQ